MSEEDKQIGVRLPIKLREEVENLVKEGEFKNISDVVKTALRFYLDYKRGRFALAGEAN